MITLKRYFTLSSHFADWFHGDAFGLTIEKTGVLVGFRCHNCLSKAPPVCPHLHVIGADEGELDGSNAVGIRDSEEAYNSSALENEVIAILICYI